MQLGLFRYGVLGCERDYSESFEVMYIGRYVKAELDPQSPRHFARQP